MERIVDLVPIQVKIDDYSSYEVVALDYKGLGGAIAAYEIMNRCCYIHGIGKFKWRADFPVAGYIEHGCTTSDKVFWEDPDFKPVGIFSGFSGANLDLPCVKYVRHLSNQIKLLFPLSVTDLCSAMENI